MTKIIEVTDLIKKYKKAGVNAVDEVSFEVKEGEFFTMLGPNGAGKTTTISVLNTTLQKTSGSVKVAGVEIDDNPALVRSNIGVIFQNPSLDLNLTAEENVRFHAFMYNLFPYRLTYAMMPQDYKNKVMELAEVLGIDKEIHQPIKTFSGGMKRKLEIVRGLIHKPKLLFLDEPTTGLDPQSRKNLWGYLKSVRKNENLTLFLTTHYLEEAEESDRICIIDEGRVVSNGTPGKIKSDLVEEYVELDTQDRRKLAAELYRLQLKFEGAGPFKVWVKNDQIQEVLGGVKTKLSSVKMHAPTLEEAYLEVISKDHGKNN